MLLFKASAGKVMQVGAFVTDQLRIQRVTLFEAGKAPSSDAVFSGMEDTAAYGGPAFDELDDTLQNAFYEWLAEKGAFSLCGTKGGNACARLPL